MTPRNARQALQSQETELTSGSNSSVACLDFCDQVAAAHEIALSRWMAFRVAGSGEDGYEAFADIRLKVLSGDRRPVERAGTTFFHSCVHHRITDIARKTSFRETSHEALLEAARSRGDGYASRYESLGGVSQQPDLIALEDEVSRATRVRNAGRRIATFLENLSPLERAVMNAGFRDLIRRRVVEKGSADDLETLVSEIEEAWGVDFGRVTGTGELARVLGIKPNTVSLWLHRLWKRLLAQFKDERSFNGRGGGMSRRAAA